MNTYEYANHQTREIIALKSLLREIVEAHESGHFLGDLIEKAHELSRYPPAGPERPDVLARAKYCECEAKPIDAHMLGPHHHENCQLFRTREVSVANSRPAPWHCPPDRLG